MSSIQMDVTLEHEDSPFFLGLTQALGAFVSQPGSLVDAPEAVSWARLGIVDAMASALAAIDEPVTKIARQYARRVAAGGRGGAGLVHGRDAPRRPGGVRQWRSKSRTGL